jgi:Methyltransferase domain
MLGRALRYVVKHPRAAAANVLGDPRETWTRLYDDYVHARERRRPACEYRASTDWEQRLHDFLAIPWPCGAMSEPAALWPQAIAPLEERGIRVGPESFSYWNDGDPGLIRAVWCLVRHLQPTKVVETGVGHGMTSRFILEALERNGAGRLWSIDLPPLNPVWQEQVGLAVGDRFADRWSLIRGSSRLRLPNLLSQLGEIDIFIHDSLHTERNLRFELDRAWMVLRPGGAIVVDDVDSNWGFSSFLETFSAHRSLICEAEPLHPDLRRFNNKGLFGIILKDPTPRRL